MVTAALWFLLGGCRTEDPPATPPSFTCPQLQWAQPLAGNTIEHAYAVDVLEGGDVYVAGGQGALTSFGFDTEGQPVELQSACGSVYEDAFVARYSRDGVVQWVSTLGNCELSRAHAVVSLPDGGVGVAGIFGDALTVAGVTYQNTDTVTPGASQVFVSRFDPEGTPLWLVPGYQDFLSGVGAIAADPAGNLFVGGVVQSETGLRFPGAEPLLPYFPEGEYSSAYEGFLVSTDPAGAVRWASLFGSSGSTDRIGQLAISGNNLLGTIPLVQDEIWFHPTDPAARFTATGGVLSRWDAATGAWQQATGVSTPLSSETTGLVARGEDEVVTGIRAVHDRVFGTGPKALTWSGASAHGLLSTWDASALDWHSNVLLDDDPDPSSGRTTPHWLDTNSSNWILASGYLSGTTTFTTDPSQTVEGGPQGDGFVALLDPDLNLKCAYWMPGPDVEDVRAALAEDGSFAVVGNYNEITLEPGTPRELTLTGPADAFVAWFAAP